MWFIIVPVAVAGLGFLGYKEYQKTHPKNPAHPPVPQGTPGVPLASPGAPQVITPVAPAPLGTPPTVVPAPQAPRNQPVVPPTPSNPTPPVVLPTVTIVGNPTPFQPGPVPTLPAIPAAGKNVTAAHKTGQQSLVNWLTQTGIDDTAFLPVLGSTHYSSNDAGGAVDNRTQAVTWLFQRYVNMILAPGTPLTEDGLFGTNTYNALKMYATPGASA
jgi:hypothetical protein